ncbi:MAG: cryptochrome/photolyase family protein [Chitinophagales bacterium]
MKHEVSIHWFRRDLRLFDNTALYHALNSGYPVVPLFIFDKNILGDLPDADDARVTFIYQHISAMQTQLRALGASLYVAYGKPDEIWKQLFSIFNVKAVFWNKDYEPYARTRDADIMELLQSHQVNCYTYKDQVLMEEHEVLKEDGTPYTVFTPYSKKHKAQMHKTPLAHFASEDLMHHFFQTSPFDLPSLQTMGFKKSELKLPSPVADENIIANYHATRNYPAINGTSRLSVHLRFGTISIRQLAAKAIELNDAFLNELIWRDFYQMILFHFPHVVHASFKQAYDRIEWRNNEKEFEAWCNGVTGYPLVDAGMRELNATGYMHNRVRMVVASFLTKHLLIDWRWGEAYFARKLLDFELASNNGGWQWAAGSGCDAAPYFRIFNPAEQLKKFDAQLHYVRRWVPEFDSLHYPLPIVEHTFARNRVLAVYKKSLG